jgi:hypothetical protein
LEVFYTPKPVNLNKQLLRAEKAMKKLMKAVLYAFTAMMLLAACKDKSEDIDDTAPIVNSGTVKISFESEWQGAPYANPAVVEDNFGNQLRIDKFTSYISSLALIKDDGSEQLLRDYSLINFLQPSSMEFIVPKGNYTGIKFLIGVPANVNTNTDPAQYPSDHVLSVAGSQGMFWTWASGYIFTKLEGKADTTATNQPMLHPFAYHTGDDHYSKWVTVSKNINVQPSSQHHAALIADMNLIFSPVDGTSFDLSDISGFHSPGPSMAAFVTNLSNAFTVE